MSPIDGAHRSHANVTSARALIGLILILIGFFAMYFATPAVIPLGMLATLLATWAIVILIATGTFLIAKLSLRVSALSILAAMLLMLPISIIYVTPLPGDSQILFGSLVALAAVLLIRFYKRTNRPRDHNTKENSTGSQESSRKSLAERYSMQSLTSPKKLLGYIIIAASGLLLFFIIPEALAFGLLATSLVLVLIVAVGVAGYSLISPMSFKHFIGWLISALIVVLLPFVFILPTELQILTGSLLIFAIILLFYWGYRKITKDKKQQT